MVTGGFPSQRARDVESFSMSKPHPAAQLSEHNNKLMGMIKMMINEAYCHEYFEYRWAENP